MTNLLKKISVSLLLLLPALCSPGQKTEAELLITGYAGGNRDSRIMLYRYADPVSRHSIFIDATLPDSSGRFSFTVENRGITQYFLRNGKHDNHFFAGDSSRIDIVCYPYEPISQSAVSDPFFSFEEIDAADNNRYSINNRILELEEKYERALIRQSGHLQIAQDQPLPDDPLYSTLRPDITDHQFVIEWYHYREASLRVAHMVNMKRRRETLREYDNYFNPENEAASELITALYQRYIRELLSMSGYDVSAGVMEEGGNPQLMIDITVRETGLGRESAEYLLLDNLYREFFDSRFDRAGVASVTAWFIENGVSDRIRGIASSLNYLMRGVLPGGELPGFRLKGSDGEYYSQESFTGSHLLLVFLDTRSFITWPEMELLKKNITPYIDYIEVVAVLCDPDFNRAQALMKERGYNWLMLDASSEYGLQSAYNTRPLPLFVLAGPEYKIVSRPAPWPSENLFNLIGTTLQPYLLNDVGNRTPAAR
jgi:hypothetical protein